MKGYGQYCALARSLDRIGDRWTLLIIRELLIGPRRYSDIRAAVPAIATNLLSQRLRDLEAQGIVTRRRLPPPAASSVYELTEVGRELEPAVLALIRWGRHWMLEDQPQDTFKPGWLALALRALIPPESLRDVDLVCKFWLHGEELDLHFSEKGVEVASGDSRPSVEIETSPASLLEVAVAQRSFDSAVQEGRIAVRGDEEGRRLLRQALSAGAVAT
ncbi:MAG: helix-turn-helix transcriptional regulator [Actinomycetota bacterium]|nr:helix-turn-helix transcriptional regulator [Actinomycetota bacterium]